MRIGRRGIPNVVLLFVFCPGLFRAAHSIPAVPIAFTSTRTWRRTWRIRTGASSETDCDTNDITCTSDDECDQSTRQARIIGPISAAIATFLPSNATPAANAEAVSPSYAPKIAADGTYQSSLSQYFPSSLPVSTLTDKVAATLVQHHFTNSNLEFLTSLCSDEDNEAPKTLVNELRSKLGGDLLDPTRRLGALGGLPLYAKSSLDFVLNRDYQVESKRNKILIVYGPHVGISASDGTIGKKGTGACGSVLGAYSEIRQKMELERLAAEGKISPPQDDVLSLVDTPGPRRDTLREVQQNYIIQALQNRLTAAELTNPNQNAGVRRVMETIYGTIDELLRTELDASMKRNAPLDKDLEIILLGGIIIRGEVKGSEDLFQPFAFDSITVNNGEMYKIRTEDLLPTLLIEEEKDLRRLEKEASRLEEEAELLRLEAEGAGKTRLEPRHRAALESATPTERSNVPPGFAAVSLFALSIGGIVAATSISADEESSSASISANPKKLSPNVSSEPSPTASAPIEKSKPPLISSEPSNPFSMVDQDTTTMKPPQQDSGTAPVDNMFSGLKSTDNSTPLNDDYQSSSSERYTKGFPSSYIEKLDEACDAEEASAAVEDCAPAVKNYFDALSKGEEKPNADVSDTISNYLDALSSQNNRWSQARVVFPPASGPAVESYLAKLATGEVASPPAAGVSSYLEAVSLGEADIPESAEQINAEINALMYSILETMRGPKLQALEEACDPDEPAETVMDECAPAISDYIEAVSGGDEELSPDGPQVIGNYLDEISTAAREDATELEQRTKSNEASEAVQTYLTEVSLGGVDPPAESGVSSYLEALSSGQTKLPKSGEELYMALQEPDDSYLDNLNTPRSTNVSPDGTLNDPQAPSPRSYAKAIYEECTLTDGPRESCIAAISSYLDYVALMGSSVRDLEADRVFVAYFERTANSLCGNAVREYIHEVASSGKAPSAASLWLYFNSLAGGRIRAPESGRRISINLNEFENQD